MLLNGNFAIGKKKTPSLMQPVPKQHHIYLVQCCSSEACLNPNKVQYIKEEYVSKQSA